MQETRNFAIIYEIFICEKTVIPEFLVLLDCFRFNLIHRKKSSFSLDLVCTVHREENK